MTPQMEIPRNVLDSAQVVQIEGGEASGIDKEAEELEELREISAIAAKLVELSALPLKSFCSCRMSSRADVVSLRRAWGNALRPRRPAGRRTRQRGKPGRLKPRVGKLLWRSFPRSGRRTAGFRRRSASSAAA